MHRRSSPRHRQKHATPWARAESSEYLREDLRAHSLLEGVPLHDVWILDLPGGGDDRTVHDIRLLGQSARPDAVVRALFFIRRTLGRWVRWDEGATTSAGLFRGRLTEVDRGRSVVDPGTEDGPFTVVYVFRDEAMSEIRNATVHAALVWVLRRRGDGYRLWWAIYVRPVGWFTHVYMAAIDPFRRWIVYPSLLRKLHRAWVATYRSAV